MFAWLRKWFPPRMPEPHTRLCALRWLNDTHSMVECSRCHRTAAHGAPPCPHLESRRPPAARHMAFAGHVPPRPMPAPAVRHYDELPGGMAEVIPIRPLQQSVNEVSQFLADANSEPKKFESGGGGDFGGAGASGTWESTEPSAPPTAPPTPVDPPAADPPSSVSTATD